MFELQTRLRLVDPTTDMFQRSHSLFMALDQITTLAMVISGILGVVAVVLSILAYLRFRHTSYDRLLQPLVAVTILFTVAHGFLLLWPTHPLVVDFLEFLTFTGIAVGVVRLVQLHPRVNQTGWGEQR